MIRRLHIITVPDLLRAGARAVAGLGGRQWLHVGEHAGRRLELESGPLAGWERVGLGPELRWAARALREDFQLAIGELSELNAILGVDWWASELAAKNPYHHLFTRICHLAAADAWLARQPSEAPPALAVCGTPALARSLAILAARQGARPQVILPDGPSPWRSLRHLLGGLKARLTGQDAPAPRPVDPAKEHAHRRDVLEEMGFQARDAAELQGGALVCTWLDRRSFGPDGAFHDAYFGALPPALAREGVPVTYLARVLPSLEFYEAARAVKLAGVRVLWPELYLNPEQWTECRRRSRAFKPLIPAYWSVGPVPCAGLAAELVDHTRDMQAVNLEYEYLARGLARSGARPGRIIYGCEGHAWEQVLVRTAGKKLPGTRLVGYDNLTFSRLVLSMFPAANEWGLRPTPHRLVTNGPAFARVLQAEGWPESLVATGCGIRHAYLWERPTPPLERPEHPARVLVASPIGFAESVDLIATTIKALGGDRRFQLLVKCHPTLETSRVAAALGDLARAVNLEFVDTPVGELLAGCRLCLHTGTTVGYEALVLGAPPILVASDAALDLDKLADCPPGVTWRADGPAELARVAQDILYLNRDQLAQWHQAALAAARQALAPVSRAGLAPFWE